MDWVSGVIPYLNLLGLGGLGYALFYLIKGLRAQVTALQQLGEEQKKTLDVVRSRAEEMDQLKKTYKQAFDDMQDMGAKLDARKDKVVKELEKANKEKDNELIKFQSIQLEEIELKKKSLEKIPELEKALKGALADLRNQLKILVPPSSLDSPLAPIEFPRLLSIDKWPAYHSDLLDYVRLDNSSALWALVAEMADREHHKTTPDTLADELSEDNAGPSGGKD